MHKNEKAKQHKKEDKQYEIDKHREQMLVDDIPLEELDKDMEDEKKKHKSKNSSESERKY